MSLTHEAALVWKIRSLVWETSSCAKNGCLSIASQSTRRVDARSLEALKYMVLLCDMSTNRLHLTDLAGAMHGDGLAPSAVLTDSHHAMSS
jgi:hypothetical protein